MLSSKPKTEIITEKTTANPSVNWIRLFRSQALKWSHSVAPVRYFWPHWQRYLSRPIAFHVCAWPGCKRLVISRPHLSQTYAFARAGKELAGSVIRGRAFKFRLDMSG